jgi:hypothetical protein
MYTDISSIGVLYQIIDIELRICSMFPHCSSHVTKQCRMQQVRKSGSNHYQAVNYTTASYKRSSLAYYYNQLVIYACT